MKLRDKKGRFRKTTVIDKLIPYQRKLDLVMYKIQKELIIRGEVYCHVDNEANIITYNLDEFQKLTNQINDNTK